MSHVSRRALLSSIGAAFLGAELVPEKRPFGGRLLGASHTRGHLLRGAALPPPTAPPEQTDVVIVGAGASGLGAAYRLRESGLALAVLELEDFVGGTSAWGDDGVVSHPWGAHYLPAPGPEARAVLRVLSDLGVVTGWDAAGLPRFDEERLCHAPEERLFYRGRWHEGLTPTAALEPAERAELARFEAAEAELEEAVGRDGRPVFQIPVERSSRDPRWLELDRISMADWLEREGYRTPFLRWYVDYATRDDFGGHAEDVSAWAGLHYFAARKLRTEQLAGSHYLVWPEGNGWLLRRMLDRTPLRAVTGAVAVGVEPTARGVEVRYFDAVRGETRRLAARAAILAVPAFVARRLCPPPDAARLPLRAASPWVVCNLHLTRDRGANPSWDSVLYDAAGLGYVDARHQLFDVAPRTVLTYFRAYGGSNVERARRELVGKTWHALVGEMLLDLRPAHPDLAADLERVDAMVWGHAMPRPRPGFLGPRPFAVPAELGARIFWAHVDQSGIALFEEALQHGVRAAELAADAIGARREASWL